MISASYKKISSVCIQKSDYNDIDIGSLLKPLGGIKNYVNSGERVLLKVNLLARNDPESAVVTHPAIVEALAKEVLKAGGMPYIGDSPSGPFSKRRLEKVYERSGMTELSRKLGIGLNYNIKTKKVMIPDGKRLKKTPICNFIIDADKIIAIPKLKTHSLMIMTLATKIMYGAVPGLTKAKYHSMFIKRKAFAEMLLDILSVSKPDLFIMDGIVGMQGDGPASGDPVDIGLILASEDAISMDLAICKILNIEPLGIPILKQAKVLGLWPKTIDYPLQKPDQVRYNNFVLPSTAGHLLTGIKKPKRSPVPTSKCTACKQCVEICPRNAIKIVDKIAEIDYTLCIHCYCCHEVCPEKAINLEVLK